MEHQNFVLKWHYHGSTLAYNLPRFLDAEILTDATLSAEGKSIKVHKLILASCSTYFLQLFQNTPTNQQPIVVLHNIRYDDLKAIISYIYYGQCLVTSAQIPRLLSVAEFLKIQGLSDLKVAFEGNNNFKSSSDNPIEGCDLTKCKNNKVYPEWTEGEDDSRDIVKPETISPTVHPGIDEPLKKDITADFKQNVSFKPEMKPTCTINQPQKKLTKELIYKCDFCGKILSNQYNLKVHLETHQEGYHACHSCSHVSRSRDALRKHVSYRHPQNFAIKKKRKMEN
ncbi:zinc finger and BTB domain-containing protein 14-like isoform X2 [Agrilus planipennis]|uniref:Zinc finger and BTB domain-containing protein 14-like isoform X2 n=2 Tax=Agrilus planipennis TaxID=224129 RepID=A0A7F5RJR9_AGRPL|nr:zinc finger and BTB domain-containing protein 14-like isoform X2 [Agrilus planipennis]